jgi:hypothetical protein
MNAEGIENELLVATVERLQRSIRRIVRLNIAAAIVIVFLIVGLQIRSRHKLDADQVVARDFLLVDPSGNPRARLAMLSEGSGLEVYSASGERRIQLIGGGEKATLNLFIPVTAVEDAASVNFFHEDTLLSSFQTSPNGARLEMHSKASNGAAILSLEGPAASLMLSGSDQNAPKVWLLADASRACTTLGGSLDSSAGSSLCFHSPGLPALELVDIAGDRAVIGIPHNSELNMEGSSAATVILKKKEGKKLKVEPQGTGPH